MLATSVPITTFQRLYLSSRTYLCTLIYHTKMRIRGAVLRGAQRCYAPSSSHNLLVGPNVRALSVPSAQTTRLGCMSTISVPSRLSHRSNSSITAYNSAGDRVNGDNTLLMKTSYTTAFALFEALWEVGLA